MRKDFETQEFNEEDLNVVYVTINGELVALDISDDLDDLEDLSGYEDTERDEDVENG